MVFELLPLSAFSQDFTTYAVGLNLLGRHYLEAGGRTRPFITLGAGVLASARENPEGAANLNFHTLDRCGLRIPRSWTAYVLGRAAVSSLIERGTRRVQSRHQLDRRAVRGALRSTSGRDRVKRHRSPEPREPGRR
ncbi:MAG TPA: hypothetical protein VEK15_23135, partial [Vicinamibacteria bacterium]|nr:hypothetical protein [Vicinamibacteria bacterium]